MWLWGSQLAVFVTSWHTASACSSPVLVFRRTCFCLAAKLSCISHVCIAVQVCWPIYLNQRVGQVPVDDALAGDGTSVPDGDIALDEDADETEEQSEKRKEAEESFKVGAFAHSLVDKAWQTSLQKTTTQDL